MRFSHFFIDRPIFASVLSVIIVIVGFIAQRGLRHPKTFAGNALIVQQFFGRHVGNSSVGKHQLFGCKV